MIEVGTETIDRHNILQATLFGMRDALRGLAITPDEALIDGNKLPKDLPCAARAIVDGDALWSTRLARRQRPAYFEGPIPEAQATGARRTYALIDPVAGRVSGQLVVGRDESLWRDPGGGFVMIGRDLRELDEDGRIVRQRSFSSPRVHTVTTTHVLGLDGDTLEIFDRDQLRERARLEGRLTIDASARLPEGRLLLQRYGEDGVALVLGLEPPSRGARRE